MSCIASELQPSLSPVQVKVMLALASGSTVTRAARDASIHRSTIYQWLENPAFADAFTLARLEFRNTLHDQLQELTATAFDTIRQLLTNPDTPPSVRLRAALAVLNHGKWTLPDPVPAIRQNPTESDTVDEIAAQPVAVPPAPPIAAAPANSSADNTLVRDSHCDAPPPPGVCTLFPGCPPAEWDLDNSVSMAYSERG